METEAAGAIEEAFLESLQKPIRVLLCDRAIVQSLLDAFTHILCACLLDRVLDFLEIDACLGGYFFERLPAPERGDQFVGRHIERFRSDL
jgi:hypothetical protein